MRPIKTDYLLGHARWNFRVGFEQREGHLVEEVLGSEGGRMIVRPLWFNFRENRITIYFKQLKEYVGYLELVTA